MSQGPRTRLRGITLFLGRNWHLVIVCWLLLFLITPFDVTYPGTGRDPGWRMGINVAVAQHLAFGREIVFTYGPYASLSTRVYDPELVGLAIGSGLLLTAGYVVVALVLLRGRPRWVAIVLSAVAAADLASTEGFSLAYPLVAVVAVHLLGRESGEARLRWADRMRLVVIVAPFALLPLVKFSTVPVVLVGLGAITLTLALQRHRLEAATLWLVPTLMTPVLWLLAGQPLPALDDYFVASVPIMSGYTQAMALSGNPAQVVLVLVASVMIVLAMLFTSLVVLRERLVLAAVVAATLFLTFKAAFVRHEHELLVVFPLVVALLVAVGFSRSLFWKVPIALACVLALVPLRLQLLPDDRRTLSGSVVHSFTAGPVALAERVVDPGVFDRRYDDSLAKIRSQHHAPRVAPGTDVDMYGIWGPSLLAQDVHWNPRPVYQSYAAYTPGLARLNLDHVTGAEAPEEVLFSIRAADGRLPALEDGPSWVPLLENYQITDYDEQSNFLELHRRAKSIPIAKSTSAVTLDGTLGRRLDLPRTSPGWLARFDVRPTVMGRLRELLWKTSKVSITVTLESGRTRTFRFIPEMGRSQFLLSPLVLNQTDMAGLVSRDASTPGAVVPPAVRSIRLDSAKPDGSWRTHYSVQLTAVDLPSSSTDATADRP